jgi:hypothetical protein
VSGNERIWHARESSLLDMNVCAANFRDYNGEQRGVRFEIGFDNFTHLNRCIRFGDYCDKWHDAIEYCIKLSR